MELFGLLLILGIVFYFMSSARRAVNQIDVGLHISLDKSEQKLLENCLDEKVRLDNSKRFKKLLETYNS